MEENKIDVVQLVENNDNKESLLSGEASFTKTVEPDSMFSRNDFGIDDQPSLLGNDDNTSFVGLSNNAMSDDEIEMRKKFFGDPKNQAEIMFQNYLSSQTIALNRQQKRNAYKQIMKNAKLGKYKKYFHDQIYGMSQEDADKKVAKLNG